MGKNEKKGFSQLGDKRKSGVNSTDGFLWIFRGKVTIL